MKYLTIALVLGLPSAVQAQTYTEAMQAVLSDNRGYYADVVSSPIEVVPVVPVYPNQWPIVGPLAQPRNPYGTGYSIVTTQTTQPNYIQQYLGIRGATTSVSVTSVVPNNAWGAPLRPPVLFPYP